LNQSRLKFTKPLNHITTYSFLLLLKSNFSAVAVVVLDLKDWLSLFYVALGSGDKKGGTLF